MQIHLSSDKYDIIHSGQVFLEDISSDAYREIIDLQSQPASERT